MLCQKGLSFFHLESELGGGGGTYLEEGYGDVRWEPPFFCSKCGNVA